MSTERPRTEPDAPPRRGRRLDLIVALLFALMLTGGAAVFPLSVAANRLSGVWITLCASIGLD